MKNYFYIMLVVCFWMLSCSRDVHEYTMEEVYKDYYIQKKVNEELTLLEHDLLDKAEGRYIQSNKRKELLTKTIRQLIQEQKKISENSDIDKLIEISIKELQLADLNGINKVEWIVVIKNNSGKDIIKVQGWLNFVDIKTKEILRTDALDSDLRITKDSAIVFTTVPFIFETDEKANQIIKSATIENINKMLQWQPTLIIFSDSTQKIMD